MKEYSVTVKIQCRTTVEEEVPGEWEGIRYQNIEVPGHLFADVDVFAHDEKEARSLAESIGDYVIDEFTEIESVKVVSCSLERDDRDEEELGIGEVYYGEIDWQEPMDRDAELEFLADMQREERWVNV